jgi:hypothetical protein
MPTNPVLSANAKFALGEIRATPGALEALDHAGQSAAELLARHAQGDWGAVSAADAALNEAALLGGSRLLSAYHLPQTGEKLWVITEATDDNGCRAATTILRPDEY